MIRQIKQQQQQKDLKIKTKFYIFETNIYSYDYIVWSREIIWDNKQKKQVVIYVTLIVNVRL